MLNVDGAMTEKRAHPILVLFFYHPCALSPNRLASTQWKCCPFFLFFHSLWMNWRSSTTKNNCAFLGGDGMKWMAMSVLSVLSEVLLAVDGCDQ